MKKLALLAVLAAFATPAFAEMPGSSDDGTMMRNKVKFYVYQADTNGDGMVSREEARAYNEKMFDDADVNKDGQLTVDEIMDYKLKQKDALKVWLGKNDSDVSNSLKPKSN